MPKSITFFLSIVVLTAIAMIAGERTSTAYAIGFNPKVAELGLSLQDSTPTGGGDNIPDWVGPVLLVAIPVLLTAFVALFAYVLRLIISFPAEIQKTRTELDDRVDRAKRDLANELGARVTVDFQSRVLAETQKLTELFDQQRQEIAGQQEFISTFVAETSWMRGRSIAEPRTVEEVHSLAGVALADGRVSDAREALSWLLNRDHEIAGGPGDYHNAGVLAEAVSRSIGYEVYRVGVEKFPDDLDLKLDYAETASRLGWASEAEQIFRKLYDEDASAKQNHRFWTFYASMLNRLGRYADAERIAREGIESILHSGEIRRELANSFLQRGDVDEGVQLMEEAVTVEPSEQVAQGQYARLLFQRGDRDSLEKALVHIRLAIRYCNADHGNFGRYHLTAARILEELGKPSEAIGMLEMAKATLPGDIEPTILLERLKIISGDSHRAQLQAMVAAILKHTDEATLREILTSAGLAVSSDRAAATADESA